MCQMLFHLAGVEVHHLRKEALNLFLHSKELSEVCHFIEIDWWAAKKMQ